MNARDEFPLARCKAPGVHMWDEQYALMCGEIDRLRTEIGRLNAENERMRQHIDWQFGADTEPPPPAVRAYICSRCGSPWPIDGRHFCIGAGVPLIVDRLRGDTL